MVCDRRQDEMLKGVTEKGKRRRCLLDSIALGWELPNNLYCATLLSNMQMQEVKFDLNCCLIQYK